MVVPLEHDHAQITLIDPGRSLDDLMPIALTNRPELASSQALVQATMADPPGKSAPLLPNFCINGFQTPYEMLQAGIFGLGPNSSLNQWRGRDDLSYQPMWQLDAFGIGNLARIKEQRGYPVAGDHRVLPDPGHGRGGRDPGPGAGPVGGGAGRPGRSRPALGHHHFQRQLRGPGQTIRFGNVLVQINRPQEAVFALQLLKLAFDEYFTTVAEYNRAQFELFHALGYPAREVTALRTPGTVQPVNTARPPYLPPVGNGSPPATR